MRLDVVVGAQFGSEAKGHVTHRLIQDAIAGSSWGAPVEDLTVVRVAGPNAGHTVYNSRGIRFALRQVPVGAVEDNIELLIAAGSEIDPGVLLAEIDNLFECGHDLNGRLTVDAEATVIEPMHKQQERELVGSIGSTGKGIGAARAGRMLRTAIRVKDDEDLLWALEKRGVVVADNTGIALQTNGTQHVIIEGTQGYGLGMRAGFYPKCTSSDCRAIDFIAMAGVAPWLYDVNVWCVARVFPIRVAGDSGPLKDETTWEALGLPEERTTVTQKIRRVGGWDGELVKQAVAANGGGCGDVKIALTMVDQKIPGLADKGASDRIEPIDEKALEEWIAMVEADAGVAVGMVTTGPRSGWLR